MSKHFCVEPFGWIWGPLGELSQCWNQRTGDHTHPRLIMNQNT